MGAEAGLKSRWFGEARYEYAIVKQISPIINALDPASGRAYRSRLRTEAMQGTGNGDTVVFLPFRINPGASWFELVLARAFRARGYLPLIGLGERSVRLTDGYLVSDRRLRTRALNLFRSDGYVRSFGEVPLHFDTLLGKACLAQLRSEARSAPLGRIADYRKYDVDIGRHVVSSLCRYFLCSTVELDKNEAVAREFLFTAIVSVEAARKIHKTYNPRLLISSHGIYASWGSFCDYFKSVNRPFVTWGFQYRNNAVLMSHNQSYHENMITEDTRLWRDAGLGQSEREDVLEYILKKGSASHSDNIDYYQGADRIKSTARELLGIERDRTVFGMFPNLGWDAQISFKPKFFKSMNAWLIDTVRWFADRPDLELIIRAHPAERRAGFETREKTADILRSTFDTLPANVHIIAPEASISSYDVLAEARSALVFGSKFGLEAAIQGKPVVTAGEAYFSGKGISFDPNSKDNYFELLDRVAKGLLPTSDMIETAVRFGYHYHVRRQMIVPLADMQGPKFVDYRFSDENALLPGATPELDHLIECCLSGDPFYALGAAPHSLQASQA